MKSNIKDTFCKLSRTPIEAQEALDILQNKFWINIPKAEKRLEAI